MWWLDKLVIVAHGDALGIGNRLLKFSGELIEAHDSFLFNVGIQIKWGLL